MKNFANSSAILFLLFLMSVAGCSSAGKNGNQTAPAVAVTTRLGEVQIHSAARFLRGMVQPDGRLTYRIDIKTGKPAGLSYNIVRHAGAIYALAQYEKQYSEPQTQDAIIRASHFLISSSVFAVPEFNSAGESLSAVFSMPTVNHDDSEIHAPLGATGLGVVALLKAEEINPGTVSPEILIRLGRFLVYMQLKDGSFYDLYSPKGGRKKTFNSLYYPGEAIYGLTLLYKWSHDIRWLNAAVRGIDFLARSRANAAVVPPDNWALIATAELWTIHDQLPQELLPLWISHSIQICKADISGQVLNPAKGNSYGGYTPNGRTTPTSARLEGLLAALTYLPLEEIDFRNQLIRSIELGTQFVVRAQIQNGPLQGAIPDAQSGPSEPKDIQIDYVQHALSSFLRYRELVLAKVFDPLKIQP